MAVRADNRLLDAPMLPLHCQRCQARVEVRKGSWHQTSIQWDATAMATCEEGSAGSERFGTCPALRETIDNAAAHGTLPVPDDGY
ncbi:MAG: ferredoxin [Actinocrinis sp.]